MAETKIDYVENKGFWIAEIYMELAYEYILQALNTSGLDISFTEDFREDLLFHSEGLAKGMFVLTWNSFINSKEDEGIIINILEDAKSILEDKGGLIQVVELNNYEVKKEEISSEWPSPMKTSEIIKIMDALIAMFKGEWEETRYGMEIDYSFF